MDDFETQLKQRSFRPMPVAWKDRILDQAMEETAAHSMSPASSGFSVILEYLNDLLWPSPKAWAAMGGVWLLVFLLNVQVEQIARNQPMAREFPPMTEETWIMVREMRRETIRMLAAGETDLMLFEESPAATRSPTSPPIMLWPIHHDLS